MTNLTDFRSYDSPNHVLISLTVLLLLSTIAQHTPAPTHISYGFVLVIYLCVGFYFVNITRHLYVNSFYFILFLLLVSLAGFSTFSNMTLGSLIRFISILTFTTITLFVLPWIIPFRYFIFSVTRLSAILVPIGFLPYFGLSPQYGIFDLSLFGASIYWYPELAPITSVFINPNAFGFLLFVGTVTAFTEWRLYQNKVVSVLFGIVLIGLLFTNYRSGWISFVAAIGVYVIYTVAGPKLLTRITLGGLSIIIIVFGMMFAVLPGPQFLTEISLNNRREPWVASVYALNEQLLFGHGLGNVNEALQPYKSESAPSIHNSYLRMFVAFGIIGGILHLAFIIFTLIGSLQKNPSKNFLPISMLLMGFFFVMIFNGLSFIGISMHSVLIALTMGYYIKDITTETEVDSTKSESLYDQTRQQDSWRDS